MVGLDVAVSNIASSGDTVRAVRDGTVAIETVGTLTVTVGEGTLAVEEAVGTLTTVGGGTLTVEADTLVGTLIDTLVDGQNGRGVA